jgi:hypothetical protein
VLYMVYQIEKEGMALANAIQSAASLTASVTL